MKLNKIRAKSRFNLIIKNLVETQPNDTNLGEKVRKITKYING
jgi:hypothetical protein